MLCLFNTVHCWKLILCSPFRKWSDKTIKSNDVAKVRQEQLFDVISWIVWRHSRKGELGACAHIRKKCSSLVQSLMSTLRGHHCQLIYVSEYAQHSQLKVYCEGHLWLELCRSKYEAKLVSMNLPSKFLANFPPRSNNLNIRSSFFI